MTQRKILKRMELLKEMVTRMKPKHNNRLLKRKPKKLHWTNGRHNELFEPNHNSIYVRPERERTHHNGKK